ncbi:MAG: hypothetical protein GY796_11550 [Chloroflexi bacterium]|nr:hypothetical protein [Chloroflexota bacterium]
MFFRKMIGLFFMFILLGGFISMAGRGQHQTGYTQGYIAGQQAAVNAANSEDSGTAVTPPVPHFPTRHYTGFSFFGFIAKAFGFFFMAMLFMGAMGLIFGRRHWRHCGHGRKEWKQWKKEWHKHGRRPPWHNDDDWSDEPIMKA